MVSDIGKQKAVEQAKNNLRLVSSQVDYLAPIKKPVVEHPWKSIGLAFVSGYAVNRAQKGNISPGLINLLFNAVTKL